MVGVLTGIVAAFIGAAIWAGIDAATSGRHSQVALVIGAVVGFGVRKTGRWKDGTAGIAAAALAILGCFLGDLAGGVLFEAHASGASLSDAFSQNSISDLVSFSALDGVMYAIAAVVAFVVCTDLRPNI